MTKRTVDDRRGILYEKEYIEIMPHDKFRECFFNQCVFTGLGGGKFIRCRVVHCSSITKEQIICEQCEIKS
jgi:hypothetical protein